MEKKVELFGEQITQFEYFCGDGTETFSSLAFFFLNMVSGVTILSTELPQIWVKVKAIEIFCGL